MGSQTSNALGIVGPPPASIVVNSPYCGLHRVGGYIASKDLTISGFAGVQNLNIFQVVGHVMMKACWGVFTDVTNVVTLTGADWNLYDGTVTSQITLAAGPALSGAALGSAVFRTDGAGAALTFLNANQGRVWESPFNPNFCDGYLVQKVATNTYVRFSLTTDINTNCKIRFFLAWVARSSGSYVVPV